MDQKQKEAIVKLKEIKNKLEKFKAKEEAIKFLIKETGLSKEECSTAYDFFMKIN